jgi:hypothetical protein
MAIRNDFAPGEVLAAADLNDTFGSKPTKTFATTAPGSPNNGDLWYDTNSTPPAAKFWDGSAWQVFSAGAADFSDAATGTFTDSGISYKYITYTASGTVTITKAGLCDVLVVAGGAGGGGSGSGVGAGGGGAGGLLFENVFVAVTTLGVTVGAGGSAGTTSVKGGNGNDSRIGSIYAIGGGGGGSGDGSTGLVGGSGGGGGSSFAAAGTGKAGQGNDGISNQGGGGGSSAIGSGGTGGAGRSISITGTAVTYAAGGNAQITSPANGAANSGNGGQGRGTGSSGNGGTGGSGVVIIRVRT